MLYRVQVGGRRKVLAEIGAAARKLDGLRGMRVALGETALEEKEWQAVLKAVREAQTASEGAEGKEELAEETILLALFGWVAPSSPTTTTTLPPILSCSLCARQSLTSSYLPSTSAPPTLNPKTFNPLTSHALFCPFIDHYAGTIPPSTTSSSSSLSSLAAGPSRAGWKLRVEAILGGGRRVEGDANGREKRGTRELLSYVRGLLGPKGR